MEIINESTEQDRAQHLCRFRLRLNPSEATACFHGKSAGEIRALGVTGLDPQVPDCATLGSGGFEWIEVDVTMTPIPEDKT